MITVLRLHNVRNHVETEFVPARGLTVVAGANGAGKTTLLEAASLFATLSSPRTSTLGTLIRRGFEDAGMRLEGETAGLLEVLLRGGRTTLRAGGSNTIARSFLGRFRAVLFSPEDLDLVRGEPDLRRRALDELVVQLRPAYRGVRSDLDRALRQRNAALRQGRAEDAVVYDRPLASAAAQVLDARRSVVGELAPRATDLFTDLAGRGKLGMRYRDTSGDDGLRAGELEEHLLSCYARDLPVELERGSTRVGPHRDDLEIEVDGAPARGFASRGEQRSAALALRLAGLGLLPGAILLLDDVLSELDADRRRRIFEATTGRQCIVTTTDADAVPVEPDAMWTVEDGVLRRAS